MTNWTPPTLQTERLILRALTIEDAPSIYQYAQNPKVAQYTLWQPHTSVAASESFITDFVFPFYAKKEPVAFGITLKTNPSVVIGCCGASVDCEISNVMEMGYVIDEPHWGKGLMSEAARAVINYCFTEYPVNRIQAHFKKENIASGKVMEKAGMKFEGIQRERVFHNNRYWDTVHYAILRSDWKK